MPTYCKETDVQVVCGWYGYSSPTGLAQLGYGLFDQSSKQKTAQFTYHGLYTYHHQISTFL